MQSVDTCEIADDTCEIADIIHKHTLPYGGKDETNLIKAGMNSLAIMRLANQLRRQGARKVTFSKLMVEPTRCAWLKLAGANVSSATCEVFATTTAPSTLTIAAAEQTAVTNEQTTAPSTPTIATAEQTAVTNEQTTASNEATIATTSKDDFQPFALTDIQRAYFIGRQDGIPMGGNGCHAYLELHGQNVDPKRLQDAWQMLFNTHAMLRAYFTDDGKQCISEQASPSASELVVCNLSMLEPTRAQQEFMAIREKLAHRRLDVASGQTCGLCLVLLPNSLTRVCFDIDLLVCDVQSFQILLRDLAAAYADASLPLADPAWSFASYLAHEDVLAKAASLEREQDAAYWQARISNLAHGPKLPTVVDPDTVFSPHYTNYAHQVSSEAYEALKHHANARGATVAMVLLTAYAQIIAAWSENQRFLINMPVFARNTSVSGIEDVVSDFSDILLFEVNCQEPATFEERLKQISERFLQDMAHRSYNGIAVQRDIAAAGGPQMGLAPLVFACNLGEQLLTDVCLKHLGELGYMTSQTPQVQIDCQAFDHKQGLRLSWDVALELYPNGMCQTMFVAFCNFVEKLAASDDAWLAPIDVLPNEQRMRRKAELELMLEQSALDADLAPLRKELREGQTSGADLAPVREELREGQTSGADLAPLHAAFVVNVHSKPEAIALIDAQSGEKSSYRQLYLRAGAIAEYILSAGTQHGELVAICLKRGRDQVCAMLGICMAGCAYVPIDVSQPQSRKRLMAEKLMARYVLTSKSLADESTMFEHVLAIEDVAEVAEVAFEDSAEFAISQSRINDLVKKHMPQANDTAYIIMTSGSTGTPKGVEMSHGATWNTLSDVNSRLNVGVGDTMLAVSNYDFDLSVYDVFGILGAGATLVCMPDDARRDAARELDFVLRYKVTLWNTVPMLLDMLITEAESKKAELPLRVVMLSGDWIGLDLPQRLKNLAANCRFIAMGGATEAAVWSNWQEVNLPIPTHWKSIPYGRPLRAQCYRVVDACGNDRPDWAIGELLIGGVGVAKGYRGDEELTAAHFLQQDKTRWYRTGDMGRFWDDDTIEFLGRRDFQVKVKGHRIELGEIESVLVEHPDVLACALCVAQSSNQLIALVQPVAMHSDMGQPVAMHSDILEPSTNAIQPSTGHALDLDSLADFMAQRLPAYMVPSRFVLIDALPISANGKLDRKAIAALAQQAAETLRTDDDLPKTATEECIIQIWEEAMGIKNIGRNESYYELGGNSLIATRVIGVVRERLNINLTTADVFTHTTVAELARLIDERVSFSRHNNQPDSQPSSQSSSLPSSQQDNQISSQQKDYSKTRSIVQDTQDIQGIQDIQEAQNAQDTQDAITSAQLQASAAKLPELAAREDELDAPFALTALQRAYLIGRMKGMVLGGQATRAYLEVTVSNLDMSRLGAAMTELVKVQSALRISVDAASATQVINEKVPLVVIPLADVSYLNNDAYDEFLDNKREQMFNHEFDLSRPFLWMMEVTRRNDEWHIHFCHDGILMDGWSCERLFADLETLYHNGTFEVGISYRDYVYWLQEIHDSETYTKDEQYWLAKAQEFPETQALKPACLPEAITNPETAHVTRTISLDRFNAIKRAAASYEMTVFAAMLCAFGKALELNGGCHDFLINTPVAYRPLTSSNAQVNSDLYKLLGECSDYRLFHFSTLANETIAQTAKKVFAQLTDEGLHTAYRGSDLSRAMQQYSGASALAPIVFTSTAEVDLKPSTWYRKVASRTHTSQVWMDAVVMPIDQGIMLNIDYVDGLLEAGTPERVADAFVRALDLLVDEPGAWDKLTQLPLSPTEQELINQTNATDVLPVATTYAPLLRNAFSNYASKIAIKNVEKNLTYRELEQLTSCISAAIEAKLAEPAEPAELDAAPASVLDKDTRARIGIAVGKGAKQVAAALACAAGGYPFMPIDIEYPAQTIRACYLASKLAFVIVDSQTAHLVPEDVPTLNVCEALPKEGSITWRDACESDVLAIINTSGSTGAPKGIQLTNEGVVNCLLWSKEAFSIDETSCVLAITNFAHDMALYDTLGPLLSGASLAVLDEQTRREPRAWAKTMDVCNVTFWNSVPALMRMLLEVAGPISANALKSLRCVVHGGDWLDPALARQITETFPNVRLFNVGGPTETTIWNIAHEVTDDDIQSGVIPYGRPIWNTKYFVLDDRMNLCPPEVAGIMHVAGVGVSAGYINAVALNDVVSDDVASKDVVSDDVASKDVVGTLTTATDLDAKDNGSCDEPQVFTNLNGMRVCCTGDRGMYLPSGELRILGRADLQVKVNGKRIEIGGIERLLNQIDGISASAVVVNEAVGRLIAYFIGDTNDAIIPEDEIRSQLSCWLPAYMIPTRFIAIEQMPLTRNGKPDRKALAKYELPGHSCSDHSREAALPKAAEIKSVAATENAEQLTPAITKEQLTPATRIEQQTSVTAIEQQASFASLISSSSLDALADTSLAEASAADELAFLGKAGNDAAVLSSNKNVNEEAENRFNDVLLKLVTFCRESIGDETIQPDDNFFAIGGDSLTAMKIGAWAYDQFGRELTVVQIMAQPTVREWAEILCDE
ncbi:MAG: amino acid adenylation domain-containing protein [Coriobacteriales bacterium]|jgi:yersiniabactin nonribosomal peptide synthetase|nr:amino acid adenylation domain-containing protein [Coriobacteriales bacterium]